MRYTVKQLAKLAGISNRTLHYYDEIRLLRPASYGDNGYRYYDDEAVLRLQQILFYRELDFSLEQIKQVLDAPDFDLIKALEGHRQTLQGRARQINCLIETVDKTIQHLRGEIVMSNQDFYKGFDEQQQKERAREAEQRWGKVAADSQKRWEDFTPQQKNAALAENHAITDGIVNEMDKGYDSPEVQYWVDRWYKSINTNFYACSLEVFEALGHMYVEDARFTETYENMRPGMAKFMEQAMTYYVDQRRKTK
jgi:DNA-binding transcriptional MerR regulator